MVTKECDFKTLFYKEMIFPNSSNVAGKHYTMLTRTRVRAGFVKMYVYYSISGNDRLQFTDKYHNILKRGQLSF